MEVYTASKARENLYKLIDHVAEIHAPIYITGKRNKVVVMSEEDYRSIQETLYILSVPGMRESITEGIKQDITTCKTSLDW